MVDAKNMSNTSAALSLKSIFLHTVCAYHREKNSPAAPIKDLGKEIYKESAIHGYKDSYTTRDSHLAALRQFKTALNTYLSRYSAGAYEKIVQKSFAASQIISTPNQSLFIK